MMICKEIIFSKHYSFKFKTKKQRRKGEAKKNKPSTLARSINKRMD